MQTRRKGVTRGLVSSGEGSEPCDRSFAEGELAVAPTGGRFVPGKNLFGNHWIGPCAPKGNAPQHYVMTLIATTLEPGELQAGLTKTELLKVLEGGKALRAASLSLRFSQ
jgi:hypothetical protein